MNTITDATFDQALTAPLAIVEFWSPACPACTTFKPVFAEVAAQLAGQLFIATANTGEAQKSAASYQIQSIPTVIFFVDGKEVHRTEGAMSRDQFLQEIDRALSVQAAEDGSFMNFLLLAGLVGGGAYLASEYLL